MLQDWEQVTATWESPQGNAGGVITNGVTPDGFEATAKADAVVTEPGQGGTSPDSAQRRDHPKLGQWLADQLRLVDRFQQPVAVELQ